MKKSILVISLLAFVLVSFFSMKLSSKKKINSKILSHIVNPLNQNLKFYWKNKDGKLYSSFKNLKLDLVEQNKELIFAMNGGMYTKEQNPQGLYIENGILKTTLDTIIKGYGNFYLQPNGVFYISKNNKAVVCNTKDFKQHTNINYATQSGPMLVVDGKIHSKLTKGSLNLHIRNGVGILPNGNILFAMSKEKINFYDFASFFKNKGCKNALYLDGFVSTTYLPSKKHKELRGHFGVIIAETKELKSNE